MDVDLNNKRKSRSSISKIDYKDDSDSDGAPLVSGSMLRSSYYAPGLD